MLYKSTFSETVRAEPVEACKCNMSLYFIIMLSLITPTINAIELCKTCSRQGCSCPLYHCPPRTHCPCNFVLHNTMDANAQLLKSAKGKKFNIELPIKPNSEQWQFKNLPDDSIVKLVDKGFAINDPSLYIITFEAKKPGSLAIEFQRVAIEPQSTKEESKDTAVQPQQPKQILETRAVTIDIAG